MTPTPSLRLCVWSGPRNISTALMYSFAQRADTRVVDEPLYGHYLRASGAEHPGREEVLAATETDGERVVRDVILGPCDRPVLFFKQMAHHLVDIDRGFLRETVNVLLIRRPSEVVLSLSRQLPQPVLRDTGFACLAGLHEELLALGQEPPIVDARELLLDPRGVLSGLCESLELEFDEAMLSWSAGGRPEDGVWAPHWYASLHRSTGFAPYREKTLPVPAALAPLVATCQPYYDALYAGALRGAGRKDLA